MTTKHKITLYQGEDGGFEFTMKSEGELIPLSGATARLDVRRSADSEELNIRLTNSDHITLSETSGFVRIPADATRTLEPGRYVYDLFIKLPDNTVRVPISGDFVVIDAVTETDDW